ncbi:hypothetical protein VI817_010293 [Penicillium citrinum]|nr:hypothetical protein VI817_010293 [Penicillium citrinum]
MARSLQPCLDDLSVQSDTFYGVHQQVYSSRIKLSLKSPFFLSSQKVTSRIRTTSMSDEEDSRPIKRRKVRKGTQSCWECKRRKVRCLISQGNVICDNCRRRNATCISQDLPDRPAPSACNVDVDDRLSRMEFLIEQLIDKAGINSTQTAHQVEKPQYQISSSSSQQPPLAPEILSHTPRVSSKQQLPAKYIELNEDLMSVWPSKEDLEAICALPVGLSMHLQCCILASYTTENGSLPSSQDLLQLPPSGSHPVLLARRLLMLGAFLLAIVPSSVQQLGARGISHRQLSSCIIEKAIRLVTTNDEMICTVEGLECVIIEAQIHNYSGNLHRAWLAVHRAASVAQAMGLHRGFASPSLKFLEPETRKGFNSRDILLRIVDIDQYLSLMLGLPKSSLPTFLAPTESLEDLPHLERMQRIHCFVSGKIIQRSSTAINIKEIHENDRLLQDAAAMMPPRWWLIPKFELGSSGHQELLNDMIRLMVQFTHYHLVMRLHLPYLLRPLSDHNYNQNMLTAVYAAREILSRYIAFRSSNPVNFYCRGSDFLAFVSIVVVCFAHISSRGQYRSSSQPNGRRFSPLAHSRLGDRGMMERTLDILLSMTLDDTDSISSKLSHLIKHLLAIESDVANGESYSMSISAEDEKETGCTVSSNGVGRVLRIDIPHFGTIVLEPGALPYSISRMSVQCKTQTSTGDQNSISDEVQEPDLDNPGFSQEHYMTSSMGTYNDWDVQGIDQALFDAMFARMDIPDISGWQILTLAGDE